MSGVKRAYFELLEEEPEEYGRDGEPVEEPGEGCEPDPNRTEHTKDQTCPA